MMNDVSWVTCVIPATLFHLCRFPAVRSPQPRGKGRAWKDEFLITPSQPVLWKPNSIPSNPHLSAPKKGSGKLRGVWAFQNRHGSDGARLWAGSKQPDGLLETLCSRSPAWLWVFPEGVSLHLAGPGPSAAEERRLSTQRPKKHPPLEAARARSRRRTRASGP